MNRTNERDGNRIFEFRARRNDVEVKDKYKKNVITVNKNEDEGNVFHIEATLGENYAGYDCVVKKLLQLREEKTNGGCSISEVYMDYHNMPAEYGLAMLKSCTTLCKWLILHGLMRADANILFPNIPYAYESITKHVNAIEGMEMWLLPVGCIWRNEWFKMEKYINNDSGVDPAVTIRNCGLDSNFPFFTILPHSNDCVKGHSGNDNADSGSDNADSKNNNAVKAPKQLTTGIFDSPPVAKGKSKAPRQKKSKAPRQKKFYDSDASVDDSDDSEDDADADANKLNTVRSSVRKKRSKSIAAPSVKHPREPQSRPNCDDENGDVNNSDMVIAPVPKKRALKGK